MLDNFLAFPYNNKCKGKQLLKKIIKRCETK